MSVTSSDGSRLVHRQEIAHRGDADARTFPEKNAVLWNELMDHINDRSESWKYMKYTNR